MIVWATRLLNDEEEGEEGEGLQYNVDSADTENKVAVANATVTIYKVHATYNARPENVSVLYSGRTNEDGLLLVSPPSDVMASHRRGGVDRWWYGPDISNHEEEDTHFSYQRPYYYHHSVKLYALVQAGTEMVVSESLPTAWKVEEPRHLAVEVTTDRAIYRPGDEVHNFHSYCVEGHLIFFFVSSFFFSPFFFFFFFFFFF